MNITHLISSRFIQGSDKHKTISFMLKVCSISIFMSMMALTIVTAIMTGFEDTTHAKLQGIHSDIMILSPGKPLNYDKIKSYISTHYPDMIQAISPIQSREVIIQKKSDPRAKNLINLKGIDPAQEINTTTLKDVVKPHTQSLNHLENDYTIILGSQLAQSINVRVGDTIDILVPDHTGSAIKIQMDTVTCTVTGLCKTGIDEVDEHTAYINMNTYQDISDQGIEQINIKLCNPSHESHARFIIEKDIQARTLSWKDLYPALVSALTLEKYAMIALLALITFIAGLNIVSLLFMYITQKKESIALLYAMGMSMKDIRAIFLTLGSKITLYASTLGLAAGLFISTLCQWYPCIKLPDAYYVTYLPFTVDIYTTGILYLLVIVTGYISSWYAVKHISSLSPCAILRT
jgi:lipoprotein-releasing system permease protein